MKIRLDFCSTTALLTSITALVAFIIAYNTPPLSGMLCKGGCFEYPYLNIASRFPRDYYWMLPTMVFLVLYLITMICLKDKAKSEKRLFGQISVAFASVSAAVLLVTYFIQLSVIQPALLHGETDCISILTQFNPHGLFIALEEFGYSVMGISFLFAGLVMEDKTKLEKWIKWIFILSFILVAVSLGFILAKFGLQREYIFELASITITWFTLIINGFLLSRFFVRD